MQDCVSRDETQEVCEGLLREDARITYHREKDSGQSDGINRGLARSTGTLWTWMPSDDFYSHPEAISGLVADFERAQRSEPGGVGVFGRAQYVTQGGEWLRAYEQLERDLTRADFRLDWPLCQPASLLLREAVVECAGVDPTLVLAMDLDLLLRLLHGDRRLVFSPRIVASVRVHAGSKSVKHARETARTALAVIRRRTGSVGNPLRSAYAAEYSRATRHEWRQSWRFFLVKLRRRWRRGRARLLFRMGPETGFAGVIPLNQMRMTEDEQGLLLESSGIDPHLLVPGISVAEKGLVQVRVRIAPPASTPMQIFYQGSGAAVRKLMGLPPVFTEGRSRTVTIGGPGRPLAFQLRGRLLERPFRLDPGSLPGRYRLKSLEVRSLPLGLVHRAVLRVAEWGNVDNRLMDCFLRLWVAFSRPSLARAGDRHTTTPRPRVAERSETA